MSKLTDYKLLCFDIYGTLIDWETGVLTALEPALSTSNTTFTKQHLLSVYHHYEATQQSQTPDLPYSQLLTLIHPLICSHLNLPAPSTSSSQTFGASISSWPAFPDTISALRRLSPHFHLVPLSNVDRASFSLTNSGPLQSFPFTRIITAQDVGSYKPSLRNFEYMLETVKREFGVEKHEVLQTAQSQFHDHQPAKKMGVRSVWIVRPGAIMGNLTEEGKDKEVWDWRFDTLGELADAVEKEIREKKEEEGKEEKD